MDKADLISRLLDVIEFDIAPVTRQGVARGNKLFGELEGIAYRTNYDLTQHQEHSGQKMDYLDPERNNEKYIPHVIEPAAGLTRGVLALLCEAYTIDPSRPSGVYLNFHPKIAPKKAAIHCRVPAQPGNPADQGTGRAL